jgi:DNA repair exonuclease SbcCD ATPase subunit
MAKITFHEVGWKNFLSTGNTYNVVHLDKTSTTLLYGDSGSGKTTVADALCYALYKRPLRPINLPQLINSINNGECEVYAKFTVNGDLYKVTRGLKPAVFEIEVNGKPLDLASGREPQDWLESLLGMTFKTWKHVVSLGNASYTPFLQLAAKDRRELVEDLRDLDVFSSMQKLAKEEVSALNKTKAVLESDYKVLSSNATLLRSFISEAEKQSIDRKAEIQKDIDELVNKATSAKSAKDDLIDLGKLKSVEFVGYEETKVEYNAILKEKQNAEYKLNDLKSKINAVDDLTKCPTCYQEVTESHKTHIHTSGNAAIAKLEAGLAKIQPELDKLREACDNFAKIETRYYRYNT